MVYDSDWIWIVNAVHFILINQYKWINFLAHLFCQHGNFSYCSLHAYCITHVIWIIITFTRLDQCNGHVTNGIHIVFPQWNSKIFSGGGSGCIPNQNRFSWKEFFMCPISVHVNKLYIVHWKLAFRLCMRKK